MSSLPTAVVEPLEVRRLFALDPSAREQEMLELVNRMRTNPQAELSLLTNSSNTDVNSAISFFHVDTSALASQWSSLTAVQPLAWNANLASSALGHSNKMLANQLQSHQLPGEKDL